MPATKAPLISSCVCITLAACASSPKKSFVSNYSAGFAAKQTCSCLYVSRRTLDSCKSDYDIGLTPEIARSLSWAVTPTTVTVTSGDGAVSREARFDDGFGCHLVN
jgi:hypothetical protein